MQKIHLQRMAVPAACLLLFITAALFRPLLPIDETRYLSVAWEMLLRHGWLSPLTLNGEPYHHKPPLLFWLVNLSWGVFGVSRWAGTIPAILSAAACIYLTARLARALFPDPRGTADIKLIMLGGLPFLIYGTLILFDFTVAAFTLGSLLCLIGYTRDRKPWRVAVMALLLGFGVLTKGPVAYLYVVYPIVFAPLWMEQKHGLAGWYRGCAAALALSILPVLFWLVPVLQAADNHFAFWLLWEQTAGRISGNFNDAHVRPFYFYLILLPLFFMPWIFFPAFLRGAKDIGEQMKNSSGLRFLLCWLVPTFFTFSFISGKQPHYMVPLLPGMAILTGVFLRNAGSKTIGRVAAAMIALCIFGQIAAAGRIFASYDLQPVVEIVRAEARHDIAFIPNYHGEITFLARLKKPVEILEKGRLKNWFAAHPGGIAVIHYAKPEEVRKFHARFSMPYRGKLIGVFSACQASPEPRSPHTRRC